jgi:hypothetical protein
VPSSTATTRLAVKIALTGYFLDRCLHRPTSGPNFEFRAAMPVVPDDLELVDPAVPLTRVSVATP